MMKKILTAALSMVCTLFSCTAADDIPTLSPQEYQTTLQADTTAVLIDVRQADEYKEGHLAGARNLDYLTPDEFRLGINLLDPSRTYYIYCRSGRRSHAAALQMQKQGLRVIDLRGGILAWQQAGLPVEK